MKKIVLVFMILAIMLTGCNNAETSSNETINETNTSETAEISEEALDRIPFEVLMDKPSLENGKEKGNDRYYCHRYRGLGLYGFI